MDIKKTAHLIIGMGGLTIQQPRHSAEFLVRCMVGSLCRGGYRILCMKNTVISGLFSYYAR